MRVYIYFLIAALAAASLPAETAWAGGPPVQWEKTFGGSGIEFGNSVQQTTDGGYIIAGYTNSFGVGNYDVYLIKTEPNGNNQWQKTLGGSKSDVGNSVRQTFDGGYIIAGNTSLEYGNDDVYLIKTEPNGVLQWEKTFGGSAFDFGNSVQQTTDGGYIIAGTTSSFPYLGAGGYEVYLIKTDSTGNKTWEKIFGGTHNDHGQSVQQTSDGGYIIAGYTGSFGTGAPGFPNVYLIKTDSSGNLSWQKTFGGNNEDYGWSVQQTTDGGYIIAGQTNSFGAGNTDVYLIKTDSSGNLIWQKTFGGSSDDGVWSVQQTTDGGFIAAGYTKSFSAGDPNVYLVKTDANGNLLWQQSLGGSNYDSGSTVKQTTDKGFIFTGTTQSFGAGSYDVYLIKLNADGDRDGDGLLDSWETRGIDINDNNTIDLDLPALGADPNHKDLFVEIDAMVGRAPVKATIQRVVNAFATVPNALVNNPDGNDGITLHCLPLDETNIPLNNWPNAFADFDAVKANLDPKVPGGFGTPAQRADPNWASIRAAKALAYRYCIFANSHSGGRSSGLSECPGNDFMVTLGRWSTPGGTPDQQAGSFMHELGHNLGLIHGGNQKDLSRDHRYNWKPNFHSIMNYLWQVPRPGWGIGASWRLDYSQEAFPDLNEASLNEPAGIGGHAGHQTVFGPPPLRVANELGPVDWNRDGDTIDLAVSADINYLLDDINFDGVVDADDPTPDDILTGYSDWPNLRYLLGGHPNFQSGVHSEESFHSEMTFEMYLATGGCRTGDINCDGEVNFEDFAILGNQWLQAPGFPSADIASPSDNIVDFNDLVILTGHWLEGVAP